MPLVVMLLLAAGAGASFVVQQAVNARLRVALGSAYWAGLVSYAGGTLVMALAIAALRERWPSAAAMTRAPWWSWTGGFFGAVYIVVAIVLVPRLGAALVVALIVLGQMLASLAVDQAGAFGLPRVPIDAWRVAGALLLVVGAVCIQR